jgi:sensor histidine kinase YesM
MSAYVMNAYVRAAASSFTWRRVCFSQAITLVIAVLMSFDWGFFGEGIRHVSLHFVALSVYALALLPMAFCAEEAITRGAKTVVVYTLVLVFINPLVAIGIAFAMLWIYCLVFASPWIAERWGFIEVGSHFSVPASLALLVYHNGRTADRMLEGLRRGELRRVQLDQQLVQSRLATAEAQIDPQMLFRTLAQIKDGLQESQPNAERDLDELIHKLRSALARTAAASEA